MKIEKCHNEERWKTGGGRKREEVGEQVDSLNCSILAVRRRRRKYPFVKMDRSTLPKPCRCPNPVELTNSCDLLGGVGGALGKAGEMHLKISCTYESCDYIKCTYLLE